MSCAVVSDGGGATLGSSTHPTAPGNPWQIPTETPAGTAVVDIERPQGLLVMMELSTALANGLAEVGRWGTTKRAGIKANGFSGL